MNELIGHKIKSIEIDTLKQYLKIHTESDETFIYYTFGDCCSETWIEHISGIPYAFNKEIVKIEEISMSNLPGTKQEYDSLYCTILKTNYLNLKIEYRNSSNGYYGGALILVNGKDGWSYGYKPNDRIIFKQLEDDF